MLRHSFRRMNNSNNESNLEKAILNSKEPIKLNEEQEDQEIISLLGHRGVWINKNETINWQNGGKSIDQYKINQDDQPEIIKKYYDKPIEYTQDILVRYLKPPTPPPLGDIVIVHDNNNNNINNNTNTNNGGEAPPIIIREREPSAPTPEPIIIRYFNNQFNLNS